MKNMLNCRTLIKVAIMIVVVALIGSQMMDTDAGRKRRPDDNNTSGGGQNCNENGHNGGNAECPTCCDAWDKQLDEDRFVLVLPTEANPDGEGVLDKETCLVWERVLKNEGGPQDDGATSWHFQIDHCFNNRAGDRMGWRLPTIEELATLFDLAETAPKIPAELKALTSNVQTFGFYWSSTGSQLIPIGTKAYHARIGSAVVREEAKSEAYHVWCVRGGQGNIDDD
jgi:hypothetical protein